MSDFVCPEGAVLIPLGSRKNPGHFAIIDSADYAQISKFRWTYCHRGLHQKLEYAYRNSTKDEKLAGMPGMILMHREVMGDIGGLHVDHINHNGLDNRRVNLRAVTHAENMANKRPPCIQDPGHINVHASLCKSGVYWRTEIWILGKRLATFRNKDKAIVRLWKRETQIIKESILALF